MEQSRDTPWGFIAAIAGLAVVAVGLLVLPGLLSPTPAPTPRPTSPPLDPHVVDTDDGTVVFSYEDGAIVIRRTIDEVTTELGRAVLSEGFIPGATDLTFSGGSNSIMLCPDASGALTERFAFGWESGRGEMSYSGPPAVGQGAPDGMYLFAFLPGGPTTYRFEVKSSTGNGGGGTEEGFAYVATNGDLQASGCRVSR
jgi:hypothetical protein